MNVKFPAEKRKIRQHYKIGSSMRIFPQTYVCLIRMGNSALY